MNVLDRAPASSGTRPKRRLLATAPASVRRVRVPRLAAICALVATLNAVCWSLITPAFQVPDEPDHFAYVKQLAETGRLPTSDATQLSQEENITLNALHQSIVRLRPQRHAIASRSEQRALEHTLAATPHESGSPSAGLAASQPPLYYALEAIPYSIGSAGNVLDRLQLMRLFSALFAGLTALFAFLFVREALPRAPWAWTVGGLSVALAPLLGFMSGAVNPDALMFAVSAAAFYCLARAFRRGLDAHTALAIGAVAALGLASKLNFIGLLPGILAGLAILSVRAARRRGRAAAWRMFALGLAVAISPGVAYAAHNVLAGQALLGNTAAHGAAQVSGSLLAELNYIWQLYLPLLPGMTDDFPGLFPLRQIWFDGYVGLYGWLDTPMPAWLDTLALVPAAALALLCGRSLYTARAAVRARALELATYALMALGLLALIGVASFHAFPAEDAEFGQVRYLLPLLALLGAVLALAARGAGRRWGPAVGALIIVLFLAHDVFSQLQEIARYYG
ncbi:MAG TPA: DUF2142 domain-containing protein [Solirubrobacteraceae bacterium]|nr:DUF2142 domain-containing protein [Solirubrobacteraceae bacterium]